ncbi:hypothetical protein HJ032_22680 [Vibrio parahaemolyticus]|nr:hypothetical protein [Vibrio parahaemolyticus]
MFILSLVVLILSFGWLCFQPDWEPAIVFLGSLGAVVKVDSPIKLKVKAKYLDSRSKKLRIESGKIIDSDIVILDILKKLCAGEELLFKCISLDAKGYYKKYGNGAESEDVKLYNKAKSDALEAKARQLEEATKILAYLYKERYLTVEISKLPEMLRNYVLISHPTQNGKPSYCEGIDSKAFDIYSDNISGKSMTFIADLPSVAVSELLDKYNAEDIQTFAVPYQYSLLELPKSTYYNYVVPAQLHASLTKYSAFNKNGEFWAAHNWAFGPH